MSYYPAIIRISFQSIRITWGRERKEEVCDRRIWVERWMISRVQFCYNCLVPLLTHRAHRASSWSLGSNDAVVGPDSALGPACRSLWTGTFSCIRFSSWRGSGILDTVKNNAEDLGSSTQSRIMPIYALFAWACLADKPWLKVLLADLVWEKNIARWLKKYDL